MPEKRKDITVGDLFCKANSTNWVWKVAEFVTPAGHMPHVRLVRTNYPSDIRMFALAALKDKRLFVQANGTQRRIEPRVTVQELPVDPQSETTRSASAA